MLKHTIIFAVVAGLVLALAPAAQAYTSDPGGFAAPEDLNPGDTYKLIFVTSDIHDAVSNDINVYNTFVQGLADTAGIGNTAGVEWRAIASTNTTTWTGNVGPHKNVYLIDRTPVWNGGTDPFSGLPYTYMTPHYPKNDPLSVLLSPIVINELGASIGSVDVWTGSHINGAEWNDGLGDGNRATMIGQSQYTDYRWLRSETGEKDDWTTERHFYAMSELLTVVTASVPGDTNDSGTVDGYDLDRFEEQFGGAPGAESADFNNDGIVDLDDFAVIRGNWGFGTAPSAAPGAETPEPATMSLLALGGLMVLRRRRRRL